MKGTFTLYDINSAYDSFGLIMKYPNFNDI